MSTYTCDVVVVGGGQAGLATSQLLTERSIDHVVLERGEVVNSWRTERWDSLRLLTPNWLTRLPGWEYRAGDPDGYMTAREVVDHLDAYRRSFAAPVLTGTTVLRIDSDDGGHHVVTDQGTWRTRAVVVATGAFSTPRIPAVAEQLPGHVRQIAPTWYKRPGDLDDRPVLVVGASASGAQIADELRRSGREVTVAVGEHTRMPRTYRGMDIHWWMDTLGALDERWDEVDDIVKARRMTSSQLVGTPEQRSLGLNELHAAGVRLAGRLVGVSGSTLQFSGSFANMCASADLKQGRLLDRIDEYATAHGLDDEIGPPERPAPTAVGRPVATLDASSIGTVVWATGYRPNHPYLDPSLLDPKGAIVHDGGVMRRPGMFALGLPFLRRRKSTFIGGAGDDARDVVEHLADHLDRTAVSS
jgi:putative flavoprotein involved in K+ transport